MDNIGEGDVDLIKAPIVIDNVSGSHTPRPVSTLVFFITGLRYHEGWTRRRVGAIPCLQLIVSTACSILCALVSLSG